MRACVIVILLLIKVFLLIDLKIIEMFLQIRTGRVQRAILAVSRRQHERSAVLSTGPHTGAHAAVPRDGGPRLTHTLLPLVFFSPSKRGCSAALSRAPSHRRHRRRRRVTDRRRGFARARADGPHYRNSSNNIRDYYMRQWRLGQAARNVGHRLY